MAIGDIADQDLSDAWRKVYSKRRDVSASLSSRGLGSILVYDAKLVGERCLRSPFVKWLKRKTTNFSFGIGPNR
jgi:hypothetical protein